MLVPEAFLKGNSISFSEGKGRKREGGRMGGGGADKMHADWEQIRCMLIGSR